MDKTLWMTAAAGAAALAGFCKWQNDGLTVTHMEYENQKLGENDEGFRIVHVSDFHNKNFGRGQTKIIEKVREQKPDLVVITGDLIDSRRFHLETAMDFVRGILSFVPVCYVAGNHEVRCEAYRHICGALKSAGATVLENESLTISQGRGGIHLIGLPDPSSISGTQGDFEPWVLEKIKETIKGEMRQGMLNILLIHRPELFETYAGCGVDLVFCGHAHGGQIRIPAAGGLIAPNQGFFPPYTEGAHRSGDTTMVISRGIGNSLAPQRLFNRPQLISITLRSGK